MKKVDAIIIGQGLAGTCMALRLKARGRSVCIIDPQLHKEGKVVGASRSAAGLFNPITGRKMVKTWMADQLFSGLIPFYRQLEAEWRAHFLHELPIYRPFQSVADQNDWVGAEHDSAFDHFVSRVYTQPTGLAGYEDPYGGLLLKNCGYLDVPLFLDTAHHRFAEAGELISGLADDSSLDIADDQVIYRHGSNNLTARWVIYCTGVGHKQYGTLLWDKLRFRPVKGEWLTMDLRIDPNYILNRGVFMIPREEVVRVGATYDHANVDTVPTAKGQKEILDKMHKIYTGEYRILDQRAGIRPATYDRKPFVGVHPETSSVATLNGLGAKGVTLAPYFAEHLAGHLLDNTPLLPEVDVLRCF